MASVCGGRQAAAQASGNRATDRLIHASDAPKFMKAPVVVATHSQDEAMPLRKQSVSSAGSHLVPLVVEPCSKLHNKRQLGHIAASYGFRQVVDQ